VLVIYRIIYMLEFDCVICARFFVICYKTIVDFYVRIMLI
jgi:hypothetical protein